MFEEGEERERTRARERQMEDNIIVDNDTKMFQLLTKKTAF